MGHGVQIEASVNGNWLRGHTVEFIEDAASRLKVRVQLEGHGEEIMPLGKVILIDRRFEGYGKGPQGGAGGARARSRSRSRDIDWAREKGKSDAALVDDMRSRDRDKAVATGKDYAKKPMGVKQACALPREQGQASHRLMEEETYISDRYPRKTPALPLIDPEANAPKKQSAEHQARMQAIFEKYGQQQKGQTTASTDGTGADVDQSTF